MADERALRDEEAEAYETKRPDYHHHVEIGHYARILQPAPGKVILDAGGGTGRVARAFAARGARVVLADLSLESLRIAGQKAARAGLGIERVQCDLSELPFAPRVFDGVVCAGVLEHIPDRADRVAVIGFLLAATASGGRVVVSVYNLNLKRRLLRQRTVVHGRNHDHYFTMAEFKCEVQDAAVAAGIVPKSLGLQPILTLLHFGLGPRLGSAGERLDAGLSRFTLAGHAVGSLIACEIGVP